MSNELLKAFNAAADAAHIAALEACEATKKLKQIAEALDSDGRGFSRAVYTGMRCEWFAVELLNATEDVGEDINSTPSARGVELPKTKPLLIYTWLKSNTVLTRPRDYIGTEDTVHPDAAAFSVEGARSIINECRGSDLYLFRQDIIECEYMGTDSNGSIRFKRLRIVETY